MYFVLGLPGWLGMAISIILFVIVACSAHMLVRRFVPYKDLVGHNDVAGFMIAVVGVIYAVLLAFIVVIVWQEYDASSSRAKDEVGTVAEIYDISHQLSPDQADRVGMLAKRYAFDAWRYEWPAMQTAHASTELYATLQALERAISASVSPSPAHNFAHADLVRLSERLADDRRQRLEDNASGLPDILWAALWLGAGIMVGFGYLFGVEKRRIQLIMTGAIAALVAISFVVISDLDFPFRGPSSVTSSSWTTVMPWQANNDTASQ